MATLLIKLKLCYSEIGKAIMCSLIFQEEPKLRNETSDAC